MQIRDVVAALPASPWRDAALALIILGFGMKIALVPLHGWMPLTYTAAPIPAAAVSERRRGQGGGDRPHPLSALGAAFPGWGEALVWLGFISAFYGVAIGVTQHNPEDSARLFEHQPDGRDRRGARHGARRADQGAATKVAFYAANHVLVKAACS